MAWLLASHMKLWRVSVLKDSKIHSDLRKLSVLRVSSPEKSKVQLQACLNVGENVTFQFADPSKNKEQLLVEQKKARDQLQELLVRHRKLVNTVGFHIFTDFMIIFLK